MREDYYIHQSNSKAEMKAILASLSRIGHLVAPADSPNAPVVKGDRNLLARTLDAVFALIRTYLPPVHQLGVRLTAAAAFLYVRLVAVTSRLRVAGETQWPNVPVPSVLALWHRDAPSLLAVFAKQPLSCRTVILIAADPRGDYLSLLCRMAGFAVVRGGSNGGWPALEELAHELAEGACVVLTADGGGPAQIARVGAVALASAAGVPLVPMAVDCHPALEERHKWDSARNPLPLGSLTIRLGRPQTPGQLTSAESVERARSRLQESLLSRMMSQP